MSSPRPPDSSTKSIFDNFKQGDIVFGLLAPRQEVINKLAASGFQHTFANSLNTPTISLVLNQAPEEEKNATQISQLDPAQKQHFEFLNKHKDYLLFEPGKSVPTMKDTNPKVGAAYRRACKLLLINRENRTHTAHFVTKGIFWKRICDKTIDNVSVTASELRAAYRDYKENGAHPFIKFYDENNNEMPKPPWKMKEFRMHWENYNKTRKTKQKAPAPKDNNTAKRLKF